MSDQKESLDQARAARAAYKRKWAKEHPDRVRAHQIKYWAKKAKEEVSEDAETTEKES